MTLADRSPAPPAPEAPSDLLVQHAHAHLHAHAHVVAAAPSALGACAACGSPDVRRVAVVYAEGTARVTAQSRTTSSGLGAGGFTVGEATTVTAGLHQGLLAARLAPPVRRNETDAGMAVAGLFLVGVAALLGLFFGGGVLGVFVGGLVGLVLYGLLSLGGAFRDRAAVRWNAREYPAARAAWERAVVCLRCGGITDPGPAASAV